MVGQGVARAKSLDEVYLIVRKAIETRRPIEAIYGKRRRLVCPHRLGRNKDGQLRVLCYQYGESENGLEPIGSPANWRCFAVNQLSGVKTLNGAWQTAPNYSRQASCIADTDVEVGNYPERDPTEE